MRQTVKEQRVFLEWVRNQGKTIAECWAGECANNSTRVNIQENDVPELLGLVFGDREAGSLEDDLSEWVAAHSDDGELTPAVLQTVLSNLRRAVNCAARGSLSADAALSHVTIADHLLDEISLAFSGIFSEQIDGFQEENLNLGILYNVSSDLTTTFDLDRVAQIALDGIINTTGAEQGLLLLLDRESKRLFPWARHNWESGNISQEEIPPEWQFGWKAARTILVGNSDDIQRDEWYVRLMNLPPGVESFIVTPISAGGEFYGMMCVSSPRPEAFGDNEIEIVTSVIRQLASVVGNAEVYRLINHQAHELGEMLRIQQEEASKSQSILASITDGVIVNNPRGRVIHINPAAERILGANAEDVISRDLRDLFEAFDTQGRDEALAIIDELLAQGGNVGDTGWDNDEIPSPLLEIDNRIVNATMASVIAPRGEFLGVVTVIRDITKEVEADRAKSEFISTVSHELRTPMTAIKGYTDLIYNAAVGPINENQKRFLGIIKSNTDRLTALINDILDISRIETGRVRFEPGPVNIAEIAQDVVESMMARAAQKDISLECVASDDIMEINGDKDRLYQVLVNLVGNAINYTPAGGSVAVTVENVESAVKVNVSDTGIGIAAEDINKVFERFYRSDHPLVMETSGTGLGLPIVKMFVEMHGGRVWVDSEPDRGSTFTFLLPGPQTAAAEEEEEKERLPTPTQVIAFRRNVLVVDDDQDVAELVRMQLEARGYSVRVARRGKKVLEAAKSEPIDIIILDVLLPDMDGMEVLRLLKNDPDTAVIPVIMLTIVEEEEKAFELGAAAYLNKPIDENALAEHIEKVLSREGRILIVEDDEDTKGFLTRALRKLGFFTDAASDGYEALAMARKQRPDLILLDLRLPGMDGYETLSHLKRNAATRDIPIIAASAHVSDEQNERKRLLSLGAEDFLPKPLEIDDLVSLVDETMRKYRSRDGR